MIMNGKRVVKVIHVHFIHGHANHYFGSVSAIFRRFSEEQMGCNRNYLCHYLAQHSAYLNSDVMVIKGYLE